MYDEEQLIQHKPRYISSASLPGWSPKARKPPRIRTAATGLKHIVVCPKTKEYCVIFNRRTFQRNKAGIKTLEEAIALRDEWLKICPPPEFGKRGMLPNIPKMKPVAPIQ